MSKKKYIEMTIPDRSANLVAKVSKGDYSKFIELCKTYNLSISSIMRRKIEDVLEGGTIMFDDSVLMDYESSVLNFRVSQDVKGKLQSYATKNKTNINQLVKGAFKELLENIIGDSSEEHC